MAVRFHPPSQFLICEPELPWVVGCDDKMGIKVCDKFILVPKSRIKIQYNGEDKVVPASQDYDVSKVNKTRLPLCIS